MPEPEVVAALARPRDEVGAALLALAEDQWFERKSARTRPESLANAEIGLGNAEGGVIVIGLSNGVVEGTDSDPKRRNAQMQAAVDFTEPHVRAHTRLVPCRTSSGEGDHLLVVDVDPGEVVHANHRDEVYLRIGDETRRLSFSQRQELLYDKQASYETHVVPDVEVSSLSPRLTRTYAARLGSRNPERLLESRGLVKDGRVTVGGLLLFARNPQVNLPQAYVRVVRYRGTERGTGARQQVVTDVRCEGPLSRQIEGASSAIREVQPTRRALRPDGKFGPVPLVPEDVWLEGVVNAVVHRSYSLAGDHIRVEVFDDRIEVSSPGRFPGLVSLRDPMRIARFARNPRIARVCAEQSYGQEFGEGIRRMFEEMRDAGLSDPRYRQTSGSVQLTLSADPANRAIEATLPPEARVVTAALREAGRLGTGEVAELLGLSRPAVVRRLASLQEAGLIERVGKSPKDPRAYWRLPGGYSQAT